MAVDREVAKCLLNCLQNRDQRFVQKKVKLFASMKLQKLPSFNQLPKSASEIQVKKKLEVSSKEIATAYRNIEIARERGMKNEDIISCDLLSVSPLFLGDIPFPPTKSKMMKEIESRLTDARYMKSWEKETCLRTAVMVDTMSKMRQMSFKNYGPIGDFLCSIMNSSVGISYMILLKIRNIYT